jgi:hypothetical protein
MEGLPTADVHDDQPYEQGDWDTADFKRRASDEFGTGDVTGGFGRSWEKMHHEEGQRMGDGEGRGVDIRGVGYRNINNFRPHRLRGRTPFLGCFSDRIGRRCSGAAREQVILPQSICLCGFVAVHRYHEVAMAHPDAGQAFTFPFWFASMVWTSAPQARTRVMSSGWTYMCHVRGEAQNFREEIMVGAASRKL